MILVTGATGLVGRSVCDCLASRSLPFRAVSRVQQKGFTAVGDINPETDWTEALQGVDVVVHLAARVHVMKETAADPIDAFRKANVLATINLARQASKAGVKRFVFVSSINVNGDQTALGKVFSADDKPAPTNAYGRSKHEAEQALTEWAASDGVEVTIVRPPLVYGAGVKARFETLLKLVDRRMPLPLAWIHNKRSFIFSRNLADFLVLCCQHPLAANEIFTIADGEDMSTTRLLRLIGAALERPNLIFRFPVNMLWMAAKVIGKQSEARGLLGSLEVDVNKAQSRLGWRPPFSVIAGLKETAQAFKAARDEAS